MDQLRKLPNYSSSSCPSSSSSIQDLTDRPNNKTSSNHKSRTLHTSITMSKALLLTSCFLLLSTTTNGMYSVSALPDDSSSSSVSLSLFGSAIESKESMAPTTSSQVAASPPPSPSPSSSLTSTFERTVTGTNETLDVDVVDWPRSVEAGSNPTPNVKDVDVDVDVDDDERTTTVDNQSTQIDTIDRTIESIEQSQTQPPPIELSASTVDDEPSPPKRATKVLKVVKKMKRSKAKQWNRLDSGTDDDRSQHKWISLFEAKQSNNKQKRWPRKSSKRIVCLHVLPSKKEQTEMEQFNLVRKCYSVKHIKRAEATTLDTSSVPNYSPIIDPGQLMVRSPMMDPSGSEWAPVRTSPFEDPKPTEPETQTTETATILPQNSNQTDVSIDMTTTPTTTEETAKSVSLVSDVVVREEAASPQTNYLNLYEYQTTNPLIDQNVDTNVDKPLDIGVETLENGNKAYQNETHDRMDQSSSEFFPIVTNIVTIGDQNVEASNIENEQVQQQPAPVLHHNNISNEKETKDLWQVNRRKKQLKEMTMASRASSHHSHESTSSPVTDSNDTSASRLGSHSRRIPKLLVFKANRPAMYSLNGYVPKPSLHRVAAQLPQRRSSQAEANRLTKSSRNKQRRKNKKVYEDDDEASGDERDEIEVSESVSHHRRRFEPNSLTPSAANNKTKKQKKATGLLRGQGPWLNSVPKTSFECNEHTIDGVYADIETGCQAWHVCQNGAQHSFLCPAGTIFNAKNGVCDWWYNTRCA